MSLIGSLFTEAKNFVNEVKSQVNEKKAAEDKPAVGTEDEAATQEVAGKTSGLSSFAEKTKTALANFKESLNDKFSSLSEKLKNKETNSTLLAMAQNIDSQNIPSKIIEKVGEVREYLNTSGIVGNVVGKAMSTMYSLAESIAPTPLKQVVSAIESVLPASSVQKVINNQLNILEKQFFDKLEDNEKVQEFKAKFIKTISAENILNTTKQRTIDFLDTMTVATEKGATLKDALSVAKEHVTKRLNNSDGNQYLESLAKDAVTKVAPEVIKQVPTYAKAAISDEGTQAAVKSSIKALPGAASTVLGAAKSVLGGLLGKFM